MIYRLVSNLALRIAKQDNIDENLIGLAFENKPFDVPADNDVVAWSSFPRDIVPMQAGLFANEIELIVNRTDNDLKQTQSPLSYVEYNSDRDCHVYKNEQDKYYEIYNKTKEEADTYVQECYEIALPKIILVAKANKIKAIKDSASKLLSATDWKVIRHRDQLDGGQETTLTEDEYNDILATREEIRNKSGVLEADVKELTTLEQVQDFKYTY